MGKRKAILDQEAANKATTDDQPKKRVKQLEASAVQENEQHPQTENGTHKGRKRKRKIKQVDGDLPPEEQQRRHRQRELREMAIRARGEGKTYKRSPKKRLKTENTVGKACQAGNQFQHDQPETGSKPSSAVQVIVIPIFWNRKPEEKEEVIAAAEKIVKMLQSAGLKCGSDTTNALSPGQKFAYWEKQGVKVRVECGPNDARKGSCVLALSQKPGELAQKQNFQVNSQLVTKVAAALNVTPKTVASEQDQESRQAEAATKHPIHGSTPTEAIEKQPKKRPIAASGDDLGGDFEELGVDEDGLDKKRRKKKRLK